MEESLHSMTPLDEMVGRDDLQMLKAMVPYLSRQGQQFVSVYSKFMELRNTLSLFSSPMQAMSAAEGHKSATPVEMLTDIRRFLGKENQGKIDQLIETFAMLQMLDAMQEPQPDAAEGRTP